MSVKLMTSKQIRDDLSVITLTWPDGIPQEQTDRVSALWRELKRRGEDPWVPADAQLMKKPIRKDLLSNDALESELLELAEQVKRNPNDDETQKRFADIRFELRQRAKVDAERDNTAKDVQTEARSPLPPRALEIPSDADFVAALDLERQSVKTVIDRGLEAEHRLRARLADADPASLLKAKVETGEATYSVYYQKQTGRVIFAQSRRNSSAITSITVAQARDIAAQLKFAIEEAADAEE